MSRLIFRGLVVLLLIAFYVAATLSLSLWLHRLLWGSLR